MKKILLGVCSAALLLPAVAMAAAPGGQVAAYLTNSTIDDGTDSDSGTGFGIRGWGMVNPNWFVHGEYQSTTTDDFDIDLQSLRLGGGYAGDMGNGMMWLAKGEYIDFGSDLEQSGFGVHGGVVFNAAGPFSVIGTIGYLSTDDTDGLELNVGGHFAFNQQFGGFVDYRTYMGSVDPSGDVDLNDLRIGVTFSFQ